MASKKQPTPTTIPATKARRNFGEVVQRTYIGDEHFIVEKDGLPVVAIISYAEYQEFLQAQRASSTEAHLEAFDNLSRKVGQKTH